MQRITISVSEEQVARLKGEQLRSGAPVSLQIRRAIDLAAASTPPTPERLAELKKEQEIIAATGGPAVAPHWSEDARP